MITTQEQPEQPAVSAALYVGDLNPDVTETILFKHFGGDSVVTSTKICRDMTTKRSLGYGYVNFRTAEDARNALELHNYTIIIDRPCRIMWSVRDPSKRKDNRGNLYIKNIDKSVDARTIYQAFVEFGEILSFKIVTDDFGNSKGYGFIHFATEAEAKYVMEKVNGLNFKGKNLVVCPFVPKRERSDATKSTQFNNLFVKNFVNDFTEESLLKKFSEFGKISSSFFPKDDTNKIKGFGFVCFENPECAAKAVTALDGLEMKDGTKLYVRRGMKKNERAQELLRLKDERKRERYAEMKNTNLYVKNLPEVATEETLQELFGKFGTITSCRVMRDEQGVSRRFGFVCFENQEQAAGALTLNNTVIDGRAIYVAIAQSKDERRYQLAYRFSQLKLGNGVSQVRMMPNQPQFGGAQFPANSIPPGADMRQFRNMPGDRNQMRNPQHNPIFMQQFGAPPPQGYMPPNARHMPSYMGHMQHFHQRMRQPQRGGPPPNYPKGPGMSGAPPMMEQSPMQPQHMVMRGPMPAGRPQAGNPAQQQQQQQQPQQPQSQVAPNEASLHEPIMGLPSIDDCYKNKVFQLPADIKNKIGKKILDYALLEYGDDARVVVGGLLERPQILQIANHPEMIKRTLATHIQQYHHSRQQQSNLANDN